MISLYPLVIFASFIYYLFKISKPNYTEMLNTALQEF